MIYIVSCDQNKKIQLPCGVSPSVGSSLPCPLDCPKRRQCSAHITSFHIASSNVDDGTMAPYGGLIRYSASEMQEHFGGLKPQTAPDFGVADTADDDDMKLLEELKPSKMHNQIMVNMKVFSDDQSVRWKIPLSRPLDVAMKEIFDYWYTNAVFVNDHQLKDDFVWLMTHDAKSVIYKAEVDAILNNPSYNRSQKFFHLFYDIIFKNDHPDGFYWCDHNSSYDPLRPKFSNKKEFVKYLRSGNGDGFAFYQKRRDEVLSYLEVENEQDLFAEITCDHARTADEVLWIDPGSVDMVKSFGTKNSFIQNMYTPGRLSNMRDMLGFLQSYQVTAGGVTKRPADIPFENAGDHSSVDESMIYDWIGISRQDDRKAAYDAFLSLLSEYVRSNSPRTLKVGPLNLNGSFREECEKYIYEYCCKALMESESLSISVLDQSKKQAILAASLLERGVLGSYDGKDTEGTRELIKLVATLASSNAALNMNWYIGRLKSDNTAEFVKKLNSDRIVEEWFRKSSGNAGADFNKTINKYNDLYRQFEQKC